MGAFTCDECRYMSLAVGFVSTWDSQFSIFQLLGESSGITWIPTQAPGKYFPDVPPRIAAAADEVHRCLDIDAPRAAVALARAVVEATAKDNGITSGNLMEKIDAMATQGLIREDVREGSHEVRFDGNVVAHGDATHEPISLNEAEEVVALLDELLEEVYQAPARIKRVRENRAARAQQPPTT